MDEKLDHYIETETERLKQSLPTVLEDINRHFELKADTTDPVEHVKRDLSSVHGWQRRCTE